MNLRDKIIAQIREIPDSLVQEVSDFIDFLLIKHSGNQWELWLEFKESLDIEEYDFADYLSDLEDDEIKQKKLIDEQAARDDFWAKRDAEIKQKNNT
ncbi:DUF2281 domain-containing protein [Anabaena sphaerica FACHB-251]|uniref:DUF2281 domain-containing protein n=1 Tax=Anabaena sphaerica FACHB-251 TaxID=2692883 RepID=A0A926WGW6_9NOST|nr:DUF2281 domain-containing protein [Anabaena sphaerica]MBD2294258.1 DUF2281 domain-containing protein [Anabaena sphaerica FACHB-251]